MRGFFICQKRKLANVRQEEIIKHRLPACLCHIHETCISNHNWFCLHFSNCRKNLVVKPYVRNDIVQAKRIGMGLGQIFNQMAVDLAAPFARADITSDYALRRSVAKKVRSGAHGADHGCCSAIEREAATVDDDVGALHLRGPDSYR